MAVRFEFSLTDRDFRKLALLKKADREDDMTFNDYAEMILSMQVAIMYREYDKKGYIKEEDDEW